MNLVNVLKTSGGSYEKIHIILILFIIIQIVLNFECVAFADGLQDELKSPYIGNIVDLIETTLSYIENAQYNDSKWGVYGKAQTADITNILEYVNNQYPEEFITTNLIEEESGYFFFEDVNNIDDISRILYGSYIREAQL